MEPLFHMLLDFCACRLSIRRDLVLSAQLKRRARRQLDAETWCQHPKKLDKGNGVFVEPPVKDHGSSGS